MELRKIKLSELPAVKKELLEKQRYTCPISGRDLRSIKPVNQCVDHNHSNGVIRAVLPRGINGLEGKVVGLIMRWGGYQATDVAGIAKFLHGLADYLMLHRVPQTPYIHHTYKTPTEKRADRNALARKRNAAKKVGG